MDLRFTEFFSASKSPASLACQVPALATMVGAEAPYGVGTVGVIYIYMRYCCTHSSA